MGRLSRIEHRGLSRVLIAVWQWFGGDLNLGEAASTRFASVHDCFIRELKAGARPIDARPDVLVSPCDAVVVACGQLEGDRLLQAKGRHYTLDALVTQPDVAARHRGGTYVTLRLTSTMYHRFHAPDDGRIDEVIYVAGDMWNVNPPALARIPGVYCANERAILPIHLACGTPLTLVPVAAILVASIHLHFLDVLLNLKYRGPNRIRCGAIFRRGAELGYFHHGSTIIVLGDNTLTLCNHIREGTLVKMGEALLVRSPTGT